MLDRHGLGHNTPPVVQCTVCLNVIHYGPFPLRIQVYIIRYSVITGYLKLLSTVNEFEEKK